MKTLYIECKMGAAGDMLTAALYELLDEPQKQEFLVQMNTMFGPDIRLAAEGRTINGIGGTHMHVQVLGQEETAGRHTHGHPHDNEQHTHSHDHLHDCDHTQHSHDHDHLHDCGHAQHSHDQDHAQHSHSHDHTHGCDQDHAQHPHDHEQYSHDHTPCTHEQTLSCAQEHNHTHSAHTAHEAGHTHSHTHSHGHSHHSYASIVEQIRTLPVSDEVRDHAGSVYRMIGEAEAKVHQTALEQIHFHEVGSLDALADVVGCCLLLSMIQPQQIIVSPIHAGSGTVHCAHGILPVPAPATAEILKGVPYYTGEIDSELCTPTGAALLKHFADRFGAMPAMSVTHIGVGLGTKEFPVLNAVRTFLGDTVDIVDAQTDADRIADISCNLDDMTGEALGCCMELLLDAGALDVFYIPVQMKKNRPGILLHCLCAPERLDEFCRMILRHTTTRGVRYQYFDRKKLSSRIETAETSCGPIRRKISEGDGIAKAKYEFEDLKRIAGERGLSLYELIDAISEDAR